MMDKPVENFGPYSVDAEIEADQLNSLPMQPMSLIPPMGSVASLHAAMGLTRSKPFEQLRQQYPELEIVGFGTVLQVFLPAGVRRTIDIPDSVRMLRFSGSAAYYVGSFGNATIPTSTSDDHVNGGGALYRPEYCWFYTAEIRQLDMIAPADTIVSVHCIQQL